METQDMFERGNSESGIFGGTEAADNDLSVTGDLPWDVDSPLALHPGPEDDEHDEHDEPDDGIDAAAAFSLEWTPALDDADTSGGSEMNSISSTGDLTDAYSFEYRGSDAESDTTAPWTLTPSESADEPAAETAGPMPRCSMDRCHGVCDGRRSAE